MSLLLSIVVTVYNKDLYLSRVLSAMLDQTSTRGDEYEIIVVNDGSTDNSAAIICEYCKRDTRIHVLTQQNQGLSRARNNGAEVATGDYVWFVDADDMIAPNSVAKIISAMGNSPDVIPIYARTDGDDKIRNEIPTTVLTGKDIILSRKWEHCGPFYIYKKEFLNKYELHYYPGIYHEDSELTPKILYLADKVHVIDEVLYEVFRDPNSITQVPRLKRAYDCIFVAERLYDFFNNQNEVQTQIGRILCTQIAVIINNALNIICQFDEHRQREFNEYIRVKQFILYALGNSSLKYRMEKVFFKLFPQNYIRIYKLLTGKI